MWWFYRDGFIIEGSLDPYLRGPIIEEWLSNPSPRSTICQKYFVVIGKGSITEGLVSHSSGGLIWCIYGEEIIK
jgi:hypothetical protein